jgi:type I restriction enzyme M protein
MLTKTLPIGAYQSEDETLKVESKVLNNEHFKYSKLTVERPLVDEETGEPILKKGKIQPDSKKRDTETISWAEDIDEYMQRNVFPYAPDAWIDEKKTKIGYEIPFTREFYKYVAPRKSEDIFARLKELEEKELDLMNKILG